ncbi:MAG: MMPL family transporter, partial [Gammaproteobacteria bacterium]
MKLLLLGWNQRYAVVTGIVAITVLFLTGLPRLEINTGLDSLIPASNPDRLVYQRVLEEFGTDNKVVVYIRDQELWTPEKLVALRKLHDGLENINGVTRTDSLFSLRILTQVDGALDTRPAIVEIPGTVEQAEVLRDRILQNPLVAGDYLSTEGAVTAMTLSIDSTMDGSSDRLYLEIESLLNTYQPVFDSLFQTGSPRLNSELRNNLYRDFTVLGPVSALVLLFSILLFMRSIFAAIIPLLISAIAIIWTFGMLAWTGIAVNILSVMIPSLIIVIAATTNINMVMTYIRGMADADKHDHPGLLRIVARQSGLPMLLTLLTIILGFGSNMFNDIGLIRDFAITSTFAVLANGIVTILLLPVLLGWFNRASPAFIDNRNRPDRFPGKILGIFSRSREKYSGGILLLTTALCLFFFYHASTLYVTNDPVSYFPENHPLVEDINRVQADLAGVNTFFITLESNTERAFLEPRNIEKLADIQEFVREQGVFDLSRSIADYFALVHRQMQGEQPGLSLPRSRQLIAQYALLFHRTDIDSYISHDYARANIIVRHNINDSRVLNDYINELQSVVNHIAGPDLVAHIVGQNLMINRAADSLQTAQVNALLILA